MRSWFNSRLGVLRRLHIEPEAQEITGTKKTVLLSIVGTLVVVILVGLCVPSAREYVLATSKMLMEGMLVIVK